MGRRGVERQAAEGLDADRTGHRLPGRRHPRLLDSSRPLSGDVPHRSGRFGRDLHAGLPRQHPGFRIGHPTVGQQHAQSRRLDQHAQVRRRRHGGGGHAQHGQSPQLGQHDRHPPALPAGERLVPKLGRNAFLGRAPRQALDQYRHDQHPFLHTRNAGAIQAHRPAERLHRPDPAAGRGV